MAFDSTGRTVHDLDFDATHWHLATGVREHDGRVWLGSLDAARDRRRRGARRA